MSIKLESPRLILDEITPQDVHAIHLYASDPEVVRYQSWGPNTFQQTEEFVQQVLQWQKEVPRNYIVLAIRRHQQQRMLGAVSLEIDETTAQAIFGFSLARDSWGQGLATEAAQTLIAHVKEAAELNYLTATCDRRNKASQNVLHKCGFQEIGVIHEHMMLRDGPRDTLLFEYRLKPLAASM
jgi:[ribosomal protein S5]-alanine N-acetyltransferase